MKKLIVISLVFMMLFAFVACSGEPGGTSGGGGGGGGNGSELTPAEQAIKSKYGDDIFYFAEMVDMVASYPEMIQEICGAADAATRTAMVNTYNSYSTQFTVSNASATGLTVEGSDGGDHVKVVITNVKFSNPKGQWVSFDADITVSGSFNATAKVSLEVYLSNGSLTITDGRYNSTNFGQGTNNNLKATQCLQEIQALDDEGNGNGNYGGNNGGQNQNPYNPGQTIPGDDWVDGTASLPAITAHDIITAYEKLDFKVFIKENNLETPFYEYGRIGNNQVWAKRWCEADPTYEIEEFYTMIALDRNPGVQISYTNPDTGKTATSDYVTYMESGYSSNWTKADGSFYNPDGASNWHEAVVYWLYDDVDIFSEEYAEYPYADYAGGEYYHYSDLVKPYTPTYLQYYNGKYKILAQKATIDFVTCTVYRYRDELFYIADEYNHICMKHSRLDYQGNEQTVFEVVNLSFTPSWPVK